MSWGQRPDKPIALAVFLLIACTAKGDIDSDVLKLRNGLLQLRDASVVIGNGDDSGLGTVAQQQGWRLQVIQFQEGSQGPLRGTLVNSAVKLLEFLGDTSVLVYGRTTAIASAAMQYQARLGDYHPLIKFTPEAAIVIESAAPLAERRRRALQQTGGAAGAGFGSGAGDTPAVFNSLQTWRMYTSSGDEDDNDGTAAPPPQGRGNRPPLPGGPGKPDKSPDLYGVSARLVPGLPADVISTVVRLWPTALAGALGRNSGTGKPRDACEPRVVTDALYTSTPYLQAYFCKEDMEAGMAWLTKMEIVIMVEPVAAAGAANAISGWISQTGNLGQTTYQNPTADVRPYWKANIQGQGIIVGMTDTGIDMSHCAFLDPNYRPGSLMSSFAGSPPRLYLPYHRKVVQYVLPQTAGVTWFGSGDQGHGSHTAGSIAGAFLNSTRGLVDDKSTGAAPFARISFFGASKPNTNTFRVPLALDDKILSYHHAVGARISSESWGRVSALGVAYTSTSRDFDSFLWRNPDFISVVSAGNFGGNGMVSIVAPGSAKNVLTVGSAVNYPKNTTNPKSTSGGDYNYLFYFRYRDARGALQELGVWPRMGTSIDIWRSQLTSMEVPVKLADPAGACTPLSGNYAGSIILVDMRDMGCTNATVSANLAATTPLAVLYIVSDDLFVEERKLWNPRVNVTYALMSRAIGSNLKSIISNVSNNNEHMTCLTYPLDGANGSRANMGIDSLLASSSHGPFWDNRIKPDIVAPGGPVTSVYGSDLDWDATADTCRSKTTTMQGTSMAAAVTSGHLALMRQYFRDGFYPAGSPGSQLSAAFEPSGMLLKAAAICGADSLAGGLAMSTGAVLGSAPDGFQGWGRLDMSGALPLPGVTASTFRIAVADLGTIQNGDYIFLTGIRATGTGPVFATLVWHDFPAGGLAPLDLVNDLDFGFLINAKTFNTSYNQTRPDTANNVERIELTRLRVRDDVTFVVYGKRIRHQLLTGPDAQLPQRFSVFVAGHFTGTLKTPLNPAYARPQRIQESNRLTIFLSATACANGAVATNAAVAPTTSCTNNNATVFNFIEEYDNNVTKGYLYTIRDQQNRCWTLRSNTNGAPVQLAVCNTSIASSQKFAFFRNPYITNGSVLYQVVPFAFVGNQSQLSGGVRRCLRLAGSSVTLQAGCSEDDNAQNFRLVWPASVPVPPPSPPMPQPPAPVPQGPATEPWYPYPLTFRTDFYPVNGSSNDYDYDYAGTLGTSPNLDVFSNLDIMVSWTLAGNTFTVTTDNFLVFNNNITSVAGAVHGGDNLYFGTMYEEVHFQVGYTPPPALYHVCVMWHFTETPLMRVKMTIFRGYAISSTTRTFNTTNFYETESCDPTKPGFVGSYNIASLPAPTPPPAPPLALRDPLPTSYDFPLLFRVDWVILSGVTGRENQLVDIDIVVTWTDTDGSTYELGFDAQPEGSKYGGNNLENRVNYEIAYWPADTPPPRTSFNICVRWYDNKKPVVRTQLSVFRGGIVSTAVAIVDTTLPRSFVCDPSVAGYVGSYTFNYSPPPLPPPPPSPKPPSPPPEPPSNCNFLPSAASIFSLYFRTRWSDGQGGSHGVYDWDMEVAWSYLGKDYVARPNDRFVSGAVHSGDNMDLPTPVNEEALFWPTGFTGLPPPPTTFHVCVRWYQTASLNVTLTVMIGDTVVQTTTRAWSSNTFHSKRCAPGANGYVGSYNYTGPSSANNTSGSGSMRPPPPANWWNNGDLFAKEDVPSAVPTPNTANSAITGPSGGLSGGDTVTRTAVVISTLTGSEAADPGATGSPQGGDVPTTGDGRPTKALAVTLGCVLVGTVVVALLTVAAVRWRKAKLQSSRLLAT